MAGDGVLSGRATGIGSLPGTDIDTALGVVLESLPALPHLPELPARGAGADMVGRTAAALVDLHVDLQPAGWRFVARGGHDERQAAELLERDLDALVPAAPGWDGVFKVQLAGPWTLAAGVELTRGGRALGDAGACRDIADSLLETARQHLADVRRRLPAAQLVLQLDEPAVPAVLAGEVPTESGFGRLRAVDPAAVRDGLRLVLDGAGVPTVVHCCAAAPPVALLREAGADAVSFDAAATVDSDELAEQVEHGLVLWLGVVPSLGPGVAPTVGEVAASVRRLWHRLGFGPAELAAAVSVTPTCGLAGASDGWARTALSLVARTAQVLAEAPEGLSR